MKRKNEPLKIYRHQELMTEYNEMMIRVKIHLFADELGMYQSFPQESDWLKASYEKPSPKELDKLMRKVFEVLEKEWEYAVKY